MLRIRLACLQQSLQPHSLRIHPAYLLQIHTARLLQSLQPHSMHICQAHLLQNHQLHIQYQSKRHIQPASQDQQLHSQGNQHNCLRLYTRGMVAWVASLAVEVAPVWADHRGRPLALLAEVAVVLLVAEAVAGEVVAVAAAEGAEEALP